MTHCYADLPPEIRPTQAYCDAQGRVVTWTHSRNGGSAVIHVDTSQGVLDFGDAA